MEHIPIEKLIAKYFTNSISKEEWDTLNLWVQESKNTKLFFEYIEINYTIQEIMTEFNTKKTKDSVLKKIKQQKKILYLKRTLQWAAVITLFLGLGYWAQHNEWKTTTPTSVSYTDDILLELSNGTVEVIGEEDVSKIIKTDGRIIGRQNRNRLIYSTSLKDSETVVYNKLTVPYGRKFELELSDGTMVYLNSGSSLKYPVHFVEGQKRQVFLTGEAFLDVAKDSLQPFLVNTADDLSVCVLGTQFNVSAYPEDQTTEVVLVEGSVRLHVEDQNHPKTEDIILEPNFKGSFDKAEHSLLTKRVDTHHYTSWMNGELVFRGVTFEDILKRLERHYNMTIINTNTKYSNKKFNANFGDEPIETVLNYFKDNYQIEYSITDKQLIIK